MNTEAKDSILSIIERLQAGTISKRREALEDLERVLKRLKSLSQLQKLRDDAWLEILRTLFGTIDNDKHELCNGSATVRKRVEGRLDTAASSMRLVLSYCNPYIHSKSVDFVLDHITNDLAFDRLDEQLFRQIVQVNYIKAFEIVCSNDAHGEHIRGAGWQKYVDWLLEAIEMNLGTLNGVDDVERDTPPTPTRPNIDGFSKSLIPLRTSEFGNAQGPRPAEALLVEDMVLSLRNLSNLANCPLHSRLGGIAQTLLRTLTTSLQAKDVALDCLNNVLLIARTEEASLISLVATQVLVIMRKLWSYKVDPKSVSLREQMLVTLMLIRQTLDQDTLNSSMVDRTSIQSFLDHMLDEYNGRTEQYRLRLEDLVLSRSRADTFFSRCGIAPNPESSSAISNFCTVAIIASFRSLLQRKDDDERQYLNGSFDRPRKRQRVSQSYLDLVHLLFTASTDLRSVDIQNFFVDILPNLTDDRAGRASWIFLTLAKICRTSHATEARFQSFWQQAWSAALRLITSTFNSRGACFLMMAMLDSGIIDDRLTAPDVVDACFQSGSRGPPSLSDSALLLLASSLRSKVLRTERHLTILRDRTLGWLDAVWLLPSAKEYGRLAESVRMGHPSLLFDLFIALNGGEVMIKQVPWAPDQSPIYRAYLKLMDNLPFATFLLEGKLLEGNDENSSGDITATAPFFTKSRDSTNVVRDFLIKKLDTLCSTYREFEWADCEDKASLLIDARRRSNTSSDMARILCSACIVTTSVLDRVSLESKTETITKTWQCVLDYIKLQSAEMNNFDQICSVVTSDLMCVTSRDIVEQSELCRKRIYLVQSLRHLISQQDLTQPSATDIEADFFAQPFESQQSQSRSQRSNRSFTRRAIMASNSGDDLLAETKLRLLRLSLSVGYVEMGQLAHSMTDFVVALCAEKVLGLREDLLDWLKDDTYLTSIDATRLLRHIAQACLRGYEFERSEAALCLCLKLLLLLQHLWLDTDDEDLVDVVFDLYNWFVKKIVGKGIASDEVLYNLTKLLELLIQKKPRYGTEAKLPSPRTCLFGILKCAASSLKFRMVNSLAVLFDGYVLSEHSVIFNDIVDCLPTDPEDEAGITVRLFALAKLGSRWRTVLRQAVYHIFETAANVPSATFVAKRSLELVAREINPTCDSKELLHLFAPQLFFTWLEQGTIDTMPFATFGYESMHELVSAEKIELVAQSVMRCHVRHQQALTSILDVSSLDLLQQCFPNSWVYAVATDITQNRASSDIGPAEAALQDQLGKERYTLLCQAHFSEAVACLMLSTTDERGLEKVINNDSRYSSFALTAEAIRQKGHSSTVHPSRQQPSFRAKYLMHILSKLCLSAGMMPDNFWSSSLLVYVYRKLLDDAESALGPLHLAGIIRRLRILVILAGPLSLHGYPLQMLLHNLRPYLTNFQCAEDALGLFWFLLENGSHHLKHRLSYLTGLSVSIFLSLSSFLKSPQESTTQESHFVSTMSKAQEFRVWFGSYLEELDTSSLGTVRAARFQSIITHAREVRQAGTNDKHESEGNLLYNVLLDQHAERPLISRNLFDLIMSQLSEGFRHVDQLSDDVFHNNDDILAGAVVLWPMTDQIRESKSFSIWAGSVIGRAYICRGPKLLELFGNNERSRDPEPRKSSNPIDSRQMILRYVTDILWGTDSVSASMAEQTVAYSLSSIPKTERSLLLADVNSWVDLPELVFEGNHCPIPLSLRVTNYSRESLFESSTFKDCDLWARALAEHIIAENSSNDYLNNLLPFIRTKKNSAAKLLPYILHLVLLDEIDLPEKAVRSLVSAVFDNMLSQKSDHKYASSSLVLHTILYMHKCVIPRETTTSLRHTWLDIDYSKAAAVALDCSLPHVAMLMLEINQSDQLLQHINSRSSRRSSTTPSRFDVSLTSRIFRSVDDDDFFYGFHQEQDTLSVMAKLRHEGQGTQVLAFQSASFDAGVKSYGSEIALKEQGPDIVSALSMANLHGLSFAIQQYTTAGVSVGVDANCGQSLLNIHQWDIPSLHNAQQQDVLLNGLLSSIETLESNTAIRSCLKDRFYTAMKYIRGGSSSRNYQLLDLNHLAALASVQGLASSQTNEQLGEMWTRTLVPERWAFREAFATINPMLVVREATAAAMRRNVKASELFNTSAAEMLTYEIQAVRASLKVAQQHDASQFRLNRAIYLTFLQKAASAIGLDVEAAITFDVANTLWAQGEITAPVQMLKCLKELKPTRGAMINMSRAEILTDLGRKLSQARLDRVDTITTDYLQPAIEALDKTNSGSEAGQVYHNFAIFCDEQLQDSAAKDDFERIAKIRQRKMQEVNELADMFQTVPSSERNLIKSHYNKAKTWYKLDDEEYRRLKENREQLLQKSLENYLLSLQACDDYGKDVLRLMSLWLGNNEVSAANHIVNQYQKTVASLKLVPFMNQLASRLLDNDQDEFQQVLWTVLLRICCDHPHHSHYQLFAVARTKGAQNDAVAASRHKRAKALTTQIHSRGGRSSAIWIAVNNSSMWYAAFAQERLDKEAKTGSKIAMKAFKGAIKLEQTLHNASQKIPPPTMTVAIRADRDYSNVAVFSAFEPQLSIAGGVSAPKIVTALSSDGARHKMLLKGGNDDLRQDAIMEQVFAQVSDLLQDHRPTRQRNLGIRTYKVIPLTHQAGIIEFVQNTIPLHEYLLPAHARYFPKDLKPNQCRKRIADVQNKKPEERLKAYIDVTQQLQPVMRFFFMEHFLDPDEWFRKRLNYSRTTAAVSILGHIIGLGDRHGHNILLDEQTGEVVHIDLGVAFEAGRVLPVPEVVPFRLTRDLVDGMGISGVEGPFRRCCNFTLEALRKSQDAIMTILDVLRWDPLYSWSTSPLRVQRMQDQQEREAAAAASKEDLGTPASSHGEGDGAAKKNEAPKPVPRVNEPGEADRALAVVAKKLSASLSVEATVNELIRQATDEKNLSVLYCGWAAYI